MILEMHIFKISITRRSGTYSECECEPGPAASGPASLCPRPRVQHRVSAPDPLVPPPGRQAGGLHDGGGGLLLAGPGHAHHRGGRRPGHLTQYPQAENSFLQWILFFLLLREPYLIKTKDGKKQTLAEYEKSLVEDYKKRSQLNLSS